MINASNPDGMAACYSCGALHMMCCCRAKTEKATRNPWFWLGKRLHTLRVWRWHDTYRPLFLDSDGYYQKSLARRAYVCNGRGLYP